MRNFNCCYVFIFLTLSAAFEFGGAYGMPSTSERDAASRRLMFRGNERTLAESHSSSQIHFGDALRNEVVKVWTCTRAELNSFEAELRNSLVSLQLETNHSLVIYGHIPACRTHFQAWLKNFQDLDAFIQEPDFSFAQTTLKSMVVQLRECREEWLNISKKTDIKDMRTLSASIANARRKAVSCYDCAHAVNETRDSAPALAPALAPTSAPAPSQPASESTGNELHPLDVAITESPPAITSDSESSTSVATLGNSFTLTYQNQDVRIRSSNSYSHGVFSVDFKCPSEFEGLQASFFLSSNADDPKRDGLAFEFLGNNRNRSRANSVVQGSSRPYTVDFGWDCSKAFHTYTFAWSAEKIMWLVDNTLVRIADASDVRDSKLVPSGNRFYVYASLRRPRSWGLGRYDSTKAPYEAEFRNLRLGPIQENVNFIPPEVPNAPFPVTMMSITYCRETVYTNTSETVISWGETPGCGGNAKSLRRYNYGRFSGYVKCAEGNTSGLVTSFYLSSFEGSPRVMDEIDFEFLGQNKSVVQTNFWVNGKGGNEFFVPLGFDCSEDFHKYTIDWNADVLRWYIDDKLVRTVLRQNSKKGYPTKPSFLYLSVWNADNKFWTGNYDGKDAPFFMHYKNMEIYSPLT